MGQAFRLFYYLFLKKLEMDYTPACQQAEADDTLKTIILRAVASTLAYEKILRPASVSVRVCGSEEIQELNRVHRQKDSVTDVLSFPLYEREELLSSPSLELGDIVICYDRALEQAAELGQSFYREAAFLAIHSTLHLLGYDHEKGEDEEEIMCQKQRAIIQLLRF